MQGQLNSSQPAKTPGQQFRDSVERLARDTVDRSSLLTRIGILITCSISWIDRAHTTTGWQWCREPSPVSLNGPRQSRFPKMQDDTRKCQRSVTAHSNLLRETVESHRSRHRLYCTRLYGCECP
ncbi:unnamed protein product [Vitrella brassicaformis CCMP3155]|uniref:Uncharacterized protein n=1 Tax=Vitrella brassicaformis (strain CCMP3155) TaxID=1169540 RepID=A0A0G4H030_VITBC|nr:unnamed protein product [Vitrella brassicaformis CCMP3155]|eukprot:CEM36853.1 unnamed protein product [Vitrella brassicaformis CCMP3155]